MTKVLPFPRRSHAVRRSYAALVFTTIAAVACSSAGGVGAQSAENNRAPVHQERKADASCEMSFKLAGWSAIVSKAQGTGVITCDNGQVANVTLEVTGGGLTFGKTQIDDGKGVFSRVGDIADLFGSYAQAEASAGAVDSVSARALTKGEVSLAVTTKGHGWSLGVSGAKFSISRVNG